MFEGSRTDAEAYLRSLTGRYYVYLLCRPDGRPFYVGKGLKKRALDHEAEALRHHPVGESNPFKCNVIRKIVRDGHTVRYRIDSTYDPVDQSACLEREAALIRQYGRLHEGGCLTNLAGGLGSLSGAAPFSLERHSATLAGMPDDNPARTTLNRFLQGIGPVGSVPIKPINQIARVLPTTPHSSARSPTIRCAYALMAGAVASGQLLVPNCWIPRRFFYEGIEGIIENGVARDILKAGMASLVSAQDPKDEHFELDGRQIEILIGLVGEEVLIERGLR
ncbi:GIY-YIG nuclease family protein [Sphingomonas sp. dw_22]|uniref:GIY-YIG nuclease family protein n=1 Tax=Sphingomonas sp. dw_22 TaxID=2721175 RepID=UPI001BD5699B|nr:GIY-YIG nuclease family protein [Sphingomonas sp. dw_22]